MATQRALACIEALDAKQQDYTMLWWLQKPKWLSQFKAGRDLLDWARNSMQIPDHVFAGAEFQQEVSRVFKERGIRPVAPDRVFDNWQKDAAKAMSLHAKWPKPYFPVMLQTRPPADQKGCGAFVIFSSWQDAMIALRLMARTRRYKGRERSYSANMVYENQLVDMRGYDYPCRIILDCDAKLKDFGGRFTLEQLSESIDESPGWFIKRMVEIGAILSTDRVVVYEKEKSREGKASRHFIFSIVGLSTWETQAVLREIVTSELEREDKIRKSTGMEPLEKLVRPRPWHVIDTVPHHGRGQYSVLGFFDAKKGETQYPAITRKLEIVNGEIVNGKRDESGRRHGVSCKVSRADSTLDHPMALAMLHKTCYTCPADDFVTIHPKFMTQRVASV